MRGEVRRGNVHTCGTPSKLVMATSLYDDILQCNINTNININKKKKVKR